MRGEGWWERGWGARRGRWLSPGPPRSLEECLWSSWSGWTRCSCQVLVQQRYRHQRPAPGGAGAGAPCTRLDGHFRPCLSGNCSGEAPGARSRGAKPWQGPRGPQWALPAPLRVILGCPGPQRACPHLHRSCPWLGPCSRCSLLHPRVLAPTPPPKPSPWFSHFAATGPAVAVCVCACVCVFCSCSEQGLLSSCGAGFSHCSSGCREQALGRVGFSSCST